MRAAILSIGDELAIGQNLDTNSQWLSARLLERSILTVEHRTLPDDRGAIARAIKALSDQCDLLIMTGGLGPTDDDLTREALGDALAPGQPLGVDLAAAETLERRFARRGVPMPAMNRKQAQVPAGMRLMGNPNGTAPGLAGQRGRCLIFALPGPPREMQPMFTNHVEPTLAGAANAAVIRVAAVLEYGMGESDAASRIEAMMQRDRQPLVGTTASDSIVAARIRAEGDPESVESMLRRDVKAIQDAWWPYWFGGQADTLADVVAELLQASALKVVTAESCTGGLLGKMLVDRAGSSAFYLGGWVTYANDMKIRSLHVSASLIQEQGAVSGAVAEAMAQGALMQAQDASLAVAITGIAGPDGGSLAKPVGTVYIGLADRREGIEPRVFSRRFEFPGERATVRDRAAKAALQMLRFRLVGVPDNQPLLWGRIEHEVEKSAIVEAQHA